MRQFILIFVAAGSSGVLAEQDFNGSLFEHLKLEAPPSGLDVLNNLVSLILGNRSSLIGGETLGQRGETLMIIANNSQQYFSNGNKFSEPMNRLVTVFCQNKSTQVSLVDARNISEVTSLGKTFVFLAHGWIDTHQHYYFKAIRDGYFAFQDVNFCSVDWSPISRTEIFSIAEPSVPDIADYLAAFIRNFTSQNNIPLSSVTLIGHSLGADIMGATGNRLKGAVGEIFALDPAGPGIQNNSLFKGVNALSSSSAVYVQTIVTNLGFFGKSPASVSGTQVFFVNLGGVPFQPGCGLLDLVICPHYRSCDYFAESLNRQNVFGARSCSNVGSFLRGACSHRPTDRLGPFGKRALPGKYFLWTNPSSPFAKGWPTAAGDANNWNNFQTFLAPMNSGTHND